MNCRPISWRLGAPVATLLFLATAPAQITTITLGQLSADALSQDFSSGMDGPISGTDPIFTSIGVTNVALVGTFTVSGDDLDTSFGNALCSRSNVLTISAPTGAIDNPGPAGGNGWHFDVAAGTARQFAFTIIDEGFASPLAEVAVFSGGIQLAVMGVSNPSIAPHYFESAVPFDAFEIRSASFSGGWAVDDLIVAGFSAPSCTIVSPAPGSMHSATVPVVFDADHNQSLPVDATLEFSTDAGASWLLCTAAPGSSNPLLGIPTPSLGLMIEWDAVTDAAGASMQQSVDLRITVDDGGTSATCQLAGILVDNSSLCGTLCGDCNENLSGPDILDALVGAQVAAGLIVPTMSQQGCCDVDSSGAVNVLDALLMAQAAAGLPVGLTCP